MCELLGVSSSGMTTVNLSLMKLAEHGGFSGPHRDGWGVAYYEGADVRLIKEAEAAADSEWVRFVRDHHLRSHIVMAHVRRATMGERAYRNTQPFMRELGGHMHLCSMGSPSSGGVPARFRHSISEWNVSPGSRRSYGHWGRPIFSTRTAMRCSHTAIVALRLRPAVSRRRDCAIWPDTATAMNLD